MAALLLLISYCVGLSSWSVTDSYWGDYIYTMDPVSMSMGNTGIFNNRTPMAFIINPANITMMQNIAGVQTSANFTRNEDNRSFPTYDIFSSYIDQSTYSSNTNVYDDWGFAGYGRRDYGKLVLGLGLFYQPLINFDGKYSEEIRDTRNQNETVNNPVYPGVTYPIVLANNSINNEGRLNKYGVSLGTGFIHTDNLQLHLGAQIAKLAGDYDMKKSIRWTDAPINVLLNHASYGQNLLPDSIHTVKADLKGTHFVFGANLKLNNRFGMGISLTPMSTIDRDDKFITIYNRLDNDPVDADTLSGIVYDEYILPQRLRIGFNYQPRNIMRTWFNAELEKVNWSEVHKSCDDVWNLYVGMEHHIYNRIPMRLGFHSASEYLSWVHYTSVTDTVTNIVSYIPNVSVRKVISPAISAGSSIEIMKNVTLDIGFSFAWREYEALDLFRDGYYNDRNYTGAANSVIYQNYRFAPADRGWGNADKIKETFTQLTTGIRWNW